jgi:hypothetical protein
VEPQHIEGYFEGGGCLLSSENIEMLHALGNKKNNITVVNKNKIKSLG